MTSNSPDPIELAAAEQAEDWEQLVEPVTLPIEQLVDRAGSLEEIRDGLLALGQAMDVEPIRERLARGTFSARLEGDASVGRDTGGAE